jgi:hypothetical protein
MTDFGLAVAKTQKAAGNEPQAIQPYKTRIGTARRAGALPFPIPACGDHHNLHPIGTHNLDFGSGKDDLIDRIRHRVPKLAPNPHVTARVQMILRYTANADEAL